MSFLRKSGVVSVFISTPFQGESNYKNNFSNTLALPSVSGDACHVGGHLGWRWGVGGVDPAGCSPAPWVCTGSPPGREGAVTTWEDPFKSAFE